MNLQKLAAELIGTFFLTLGVSLSVVYPGTVSTPFIAALTLGLFVYVIGDVSGAHLNPAVTVGLWSIRKIRVAEGIQYVVAQVLGAFLAMHFARIVAGERVQVGAQNTLQVGLAEMVGAFVLVFAVSAVVSGAVPKAASGLTIGGALFLGILLASTVSNGVLNPAVAFGIDSLSFAYVLGPLVGGIVAAQVYRWFQALVK